MPLKTGFTALVCVNIKNRRTVLIMFIQLLEASLSASALFAKQYIFEFSILIKDLT